MHSKRLILARKDQILQLDWKDTIDEWQLSLSCIEECFSLLYPNVSSHSTAKSDISMSDTLVLADGSQRKDSLIDDDHYAASSNYLQDESGVDWIDEDDPVDLDHDQNYIGGDHSHDVAEDLNIDNTPEQELFDDESMPAGAVPYSLVTILIR